MTVTGSHLSQSKTIQILIVEDEIVIARDIEDCLQNLGYGVVGIVASGDNAIAEAKALKPDLVLMDIRLQGQMDGIQAAEQIWHELYIPVVYISGFSDRNTLERAKTTRPFGYILKPVEERELYVAIETALQQYQLNCELQKREQWLITVLRDIGDGVIVIDTEGYIQFLNQAAESLTAWSYPDALGKPITEVFHIIYEETHAVVENPAIAALRHQKLVHLPSNTLLISKTGNVTPIADSTTLMRNEQGVVTGAIIVFRDMTQRRLTEERDHALQRAHQLESEMAELQRLNQLKDDFLSTVSHELRTPLANMKMAIQMLDIVLDQQGVLSGTADINRTVRYLEILRNQCNQELSLVNDLLNLQQLNSNAYSLIPITINLQHWIPAILSNFHERFQSNGQQLELNLPPTLPSIITDETSLARIIAELLNNACKYTPLGERIIVSLALVNPVEAVPTAESKLPSHASGQATPTSPCLQMSVTNTGIEISTTEQSRIFDQFYRIPGSDRRNQGGTGLGLNLVKKLIHHLGGTIWVTSHSNQTCFTLLLPLTLGRSPLPGRNGD